MAPPVSKLPYEVLREIFLLSRRPQDELPTRDITTREMKDVAPLALLTVCKVWNQVASDTSQLYDSLIIELDGNETAFEEQWLLQSLAMYLECGKGRPLDFTLRIPPNHPTQGHLLIDKLVSSAARWRNVAIYAHHSVFRLLETTNDRPGAFDSLSSIILDAQSCTNEGFPNGSDRTHVITALNSAKRLHEVRLGETQRYYLISLPPSNLLHYAAAYDEFYALNSLLANAADLIKIDIFLDHRIQHTSSSIVRMILPRLSCLDIRSDDIHRMTLFLPFLLTPNLASLGLHHKSDGVPHHPANDLFSVIHDFIDRSQCSLERFDINGPVTIDESIIPLLRLMPNLRFLSLAGYCQGSFISLFKTEKPALIPQLESLMVLIEGEISSNGMKEFIEVVKSRREGTPNRDPALKALTVGVPEHMPDCAMVHFVSLLHAIPGLNPTVSFNTES